MSLDNLSLIQNVAEDLLRRAGVDERLPTPVDEVLAAAGLTEDPDYVLSEAKIRQAPREIQRLLRSATRKVRGVLDRRERVIHVSPGVEIPAQRKFIRCHEIMHDAYPWQRDLLVLGDTPKTLRPDVKIRFEQEANQGAAELLFQLNLLGRIARDYPTDISTPIELAEMFGASIHATFRRWVEHHPGAACGVALNPEPVADNPLTFRRYELIESKTWRRRFGTNLFPQRLSTSKFPFLAPLGTPQPIPLDSTWMLGDQEGTEKSLRIQSFNNRYRTFILIWLPGSDGFIARHRKRSRIVVR